MEIGIFKIRIYGIDTPELRGTTGRIKDLAYEAKHFTKMVLENAKVIELRNMRRGKYFRVVAEVYVNDASLAKMLLDKRLAKEYYGGTKPLWE